MSDEVVFTASTGKTVLLLVGCVAMVAAGYSMTGEEPLMGWLCVGLFGLGIPVLVMMLTTKSMYLHLDAEGFEMVSPFARKRGKWSDVDGFAMGSIRGAKMIQIVYSPGYSQQKLGRAIASGLSGMEGAIPNSYNAPLDEILKTLNEWRTRFARTPKHQSTSNAHSARRTTSATPCRLSNSPTVAAGHPPAAST